MENSVRYSSGSGFCRFFRAGLDEEDIMTSKEIRIGLSSGLEARPAAMLVQVASSMRAASMWKVKKNASMQRASWA